jgi:hypothetical protein
MIDRPHDDPADHARDFAHRSANRFELYCTERMQVLGLPDNQIGQPDYDGDGRWRAFNPYGRQAGENTTGVVIDSGVLNAELMNRQKGGRIWAGMRLRDRIDAIISHECEESRHGGSHEDAIRAAAKTDLPISNEARRLNRARAR